MALRAALLSMASTKEMKFYSTNSVGSEDDPTSDENFQLRLSDDEDCHNAEDGDNLLSKEAEEDILNKFKFDENDDNEESKITDESSKDKDAKIDDTNEDASKVAEEGKNEETSIESEVEDKKEEAIEESSEETKEMVTEDAAKNEEEIGNAEKETSDDLESPKSPKEVEKETLEDVECAEKPKETETEDVEKKTVTEDAEKETETEDAKKETETEDAKKETETEDAKKETSKSKNEECSESPKEEVETPMEEVETSKEEVETPKEEEEEEKDSSKIENAEGSKDEKKEESATSSKDEKSEEDVQKEIFKRQTNDTENLLEILDVKPADEDNLLQELKDPSSSSENNSEKDENEEECEDMDAEKMEEETEGPEVDEAMDSIDIEENVLVQEDTSGDLQNTDKETSEKIGTDTVFMETDKIAESEEDISKPDVSSDKREPVSSPPPPVDGVTCSEKTDASDETSEKVELPGLTNEIKEDGSTKETIENESSSKSVKRSLPETTETDCEMEMAAKRIKMLEKKDYYDKPKPTADAITPKKDEKPVQNVETLNCLVEFMKTNVLTKLSRNNLEQLCLQKMCEAITDKSEIGELRHQLKVQEQMIEHWRKEVTQLTKQARDLETVNTRLMSDFRSRNEREKPIMPLKITRSVGLQVNPDNFILANRRKVVRNVAIAQNASTTTSATSPMKQTVVHTVAMTNGIPELVSTDKVTDTSVPASASSFIDLTDEDDKKTAAATNTKNNNNNNKRRSSGTINNNNSSSGAVSGTTSTSPVKSVAATVVTSTAGNKSYRIVSPAVASGVTVNGAPRLMYVVNSNPVQGILTTTTPAVAAAPKTSSVLKINTNGLIGQTASMRSAASASRSQQSARPVQTVRPSTAPKTASTKASAARHPAPLPPTPMAQVSIASRKPVPPKPHLQIRKNGNAIVLSWKMPYNLTNFESIASYQLYAYQETSAPPSTDMWRKVGDIKALALPMACTLTQFADGNKYHFAVRAVDVLKRVGPFSEPGPILL